MSDVNNIIAPVRTANTPSIASAAIALAANPARGAWSIKNLGTNALFIRLGTGATTSIFHEVLKGGTLADDGLGGSYSQEAGVVWVGEVSVAGTSPRYTVTELTA